MLPFQSLPCSPWSAFSRRAVKLEVFSVIRYLKISLTPWVKGVEISRDRGEVFGLPLEGLSKFSVTV